MAIIKEDKTANRKVLSSNLIAVISISLVLFLLGSLGLIVLSAQALSTYVKENIGFSVIMKEDVKEVDIVKLQKYLDASDFTRSTEYIDREEAAAILQKDLGEDFVEFLGYNPLLNSIDVHLKAEYAESDSLKAIETELLANPLVKEVFYQRSLVDVINKNIRKMSFVILIFCVLLSIVAIALINNTIRLSVYSKRFLIRSMQLVGATQSFIRRPFVINGIYRGIVGAICANAMLVGVLFFIRNQVPEMIGQEQIEIVAILFIIVILLGIVISWISTALAVRRYLRLNMEELYY